jgi:hypothetical protein
MSISPFGTNSYPVSTTPTSTRTAPGAAGVTTDNTVATANSGTATQAANGTSGNNSNLSSALQQALLQINAGKDLSALLNPDSQQSASNFMGNLMSSLPGLSSDTSSQQVQPATLDQSSASIKLQTSLQKLITQLDGSSTGNSAGTTTTAQASSGLPTLQQSFNSMLTATGGNPDQTSLQSFLKVVAANIQGSVSIGNLFNTSA